MTNQIETQMAVVSALQNEHIILNEAALVLADATKNEMASYNAGAITWQDFRNLTAAARHEFEVARDNAKNSVEQAFNAQNKFQTVGNGNRFQTAMQSLSDFMSHDEDTVAADGSVG